MLQNLAAIEIKVGGSISLLTNYDNNILDQEAELFFNADFSNQINLDLGIERSNKATFEGFAFHNIDSFRTGVRYNPSGKFFIRFNYDYGDAIARNISTPELGKRTNYTIGGFYQVNDRIRVRYNYRYNKLENTLTNENYFITHLINKNLDHKLFGKPMFSNFDNVRLKSRFKSRKTEKQY